MKTPIFKGSGKILKTRVFRPDEIIEMRKHMSYEEKINFDMCLLLGGRYLEDVRIQNNPKWYDGEKFVHITEHKAKRIAPNRAIRLSNRGINTIEHFFNNGKKLPSVQHFDKKIKEWSNLAGLGTEGVSARSLRKTWESWLFTYFPNHVTTICSSQGHNELTSFQSYTNTGFTDEDVSKMKEWIDGWEPKERK